MFAHKFLKKWLYGSNCVGDAVNSLYVGHFKSSAHCACAASRIMQSFWFSRQLWARLQ